MQFIKTYGKKIALSVLVGNLSGMAAAVFLILLDAATNWRLAHSKIIWFLPFAGLFIGWCYHQYGGTSEKGTGLILEEIHDPKNTIPLRMAPFVLIGTVLTHLFGGSAGREGTAVQMGSTLADQLTGLLKLSKDERRNLLIAGAGAGFSAAIGTPLAGALFGLEVIHIGKIRFFALLECLVSSYVAFYVCRFMGAPHSQFPALESLTYNLPTFLVVILLGAIFGLYANGFMQLTHLVEKLQNKFVSKTCLRPFVGGLILVGLYYLEGSYRYAGLGIESIQSLFETSAGGLDALYKMLFTSITVGSGFKGGEFIPLVFIGTSLGSFLATLLPISVALSAALGFAAVFGAAANTPIACAVMACELFGWQVAPYALVCCWIAYFMTGHLGIYKNQKIVYSKSHQLLRLPNFLRQWWSSKN